MSKLIQRAVQIILVTVISIILGACAGPTSIARSEKTADRSEGDPWEPLNRGIYTVNNSLDKVTLKPVAKAYRKVLPGFLRRGVANFYANLRTPLIIINQVLQGKGRAAFSDTGRLLLNSTVGVGACLILPHRRA
ncbi:MAG: VacJ family lipoprotein [Proteobacteria bacterium]|nr:VacJ family lipoprotein [Pseudomonadota bacterium]